MVSEFIIAEDFWIVGKISVDSRPEISHNEFRRDLKGSSPMIKAIQAKAIPDERVVALSRQLKDVNLVVDALSNDYPRKLAKAKVAQMRNKGRVFIFPQTMLIVTVEKDMARSLKPLIRMGNKLYRAGKCISRGSK